MNALFISFLSQPLCFRPYYYHPSKSFSFFYRRRSAFETVIRRRPIGVASALFSSSNSANNNRKRRSSPSSKVNLKAEVQSSDTQPNEDLVYKQLKDLVQLIQYHDELYYTPGLQPQISDEEYDALTRREEEILSLYPHLFVRLEQDPDIVSSTQGIRWASTRFSSNKNKSLNHIDDDQVTTTSGKIVHLAHAPMQSLDNAMNSNQVVQWILRIRKKLYTQVEHVNKPILLQLRAEPKLDGLSVSLRYRKRQDEYDKNPLYSLVWGATRGDGQRGEDVTDAVLAMTDTHKGDSMDSTFPPIGKIPLSFHLPPSFPSSYAYVPEDIEIRGEVILPTFLFRTLNEISSSNVPTNRTFSNARNAASGILLRFKDPSLEEAEETKRLRSYLRFYAYGIEMSLESTSLEKSSLSSHITTPMPEDIYTTLTDMGFTIPAPHEIISLTLHPNETVTEQDCVDLFRYHSSISTLYSRQSSHVPNNNINTHPELDIDGAVYKVSNPNYCTLLGSSTRAPRWAIAHKYPPTCGVTQLLNVEVQVGRTGVLTPVAILSPVDIAGVMIRRATLHNFIQAQKILHPNDQGNVSRGTSVMICRAGDVIPQVVQRIGVTSATTSAVKEEEQEEAWISLTPPKSCPSCGSRVVFESSNSSKRDPKEAVEDNKEDEESGPILRCGGSPYSCTPRAVSALTHAFSLRGFNIQGISEARVQQLVDSNLLRYPVDVFRILDPTDSFSTTLSQMDGWGDRSTRNLAQQAASVKKNGIEMYQFIYSLGIRHVGLSSSKLVASTFGSAKRFLDALKDKNQLEENLLPVHGLGPKTLSSLVSFSDDVELVKAAHALAETILIKDDLTLSMKSVQSSVQDPPLKGMNVVFTGSLGSNITRTKAQELAVNVLGARSTSNTLSKSTDLLIAGEKSGNKEKKAMEMNIKIMSGDEFLQLIPK